MASNVYIYSKLSNDNVYAPYAKGGADLPIRGEGVLIKGGAGVADKRIVTPQGVVTTITREELELLKSIPQFNEHVERGFLKIQDTKVEVEVALADMTAERDGGAPLVPEDFEEGKAPISNADSAPDEVKPVKGGRKKRGA